MYKLNLLIVDDVKANIYSMKQVLENQDINIIEAYSGKEALFLLMNQPIDLVLLDIHMPDISGYEIAHLIRDNPKTKTLPIIFITAASQSDHLQLKGYESGAVDVIFKPVNSAVLLGKIQVFHQLIHTKKLLEEDNLKLNQMKDEIQKIAYTDELTQIPNRRKIMLEAKSSFESSVKKSQFYSLLMIDIDNFKFFNDEFGHNRGDQVLIKVSKAIMDAIPEFKYLAGRYGGEEFLSVLPDCPKEETLEIAEQIRKNVENLNLRYFHQSKVLTVSIGATSLVPLPKDDFTNLIDIADIAMYQAKQDGKNQVCFLKPKKISDLVSVE